MKYQHRIIISICISLDAGLLVGYFLWNPIAGLSTFSAVFLIIQFSLSNYDNRVDTKVKTTISKLDYGGNETIVRITNTGGKIIYLSEGGIITDDGIYIDFEDNPDKDEPWYIYNNPRLPAILNPGDAKAIWMDNITIFRLLDKQKYILKNEFKFKGIFFDKLNDKYSQKEFESYKSEEYFEIPKS